MDPQYAITSRIKKRSSRCFEAVASYVKKLRVQKILQDLLSLLICPLVLYQMCRRACLRNVSQQIEACMPYTASSEQNL